MALRIGEVCHRLKIDTSTLRKWERAKKIPQARRTPMGFRIYEEDDIEHLRRVIGKIAKKRTDEEAHRGPEAR